MLLSSLTKVFFVSCDVTFVEHEFYYPSASIQGGTPRKEGHWDPIVSMPISLPPIVSPSSNANLSQAAAVDHSQPTTFEQPKLVSSTLLPHLTLHQSTNSFNQQKLW